MILAIAMALTVTVNSSTIIAFSSAAEAVGNAVGFSEHVDSRGNYTPMSSDETGPVTEPSDPAVTTVSEGSAEGETTSESEVTLPSQEVSQTDTLPTTEITSDSETVTETNTDTTPADTSSDDSGDLPESVSNIYLCGLPEHTHGEACFDSEGNLVCGVEEHIHTDECLSASIMGIAAPYAIVHDDPDCSFVLSLNAGGGYTLTFTGTAVPANMKSSGLLNIDGIDYLQSVTNVVINDSVSVIGDSAFRDFPSLFSVEFTGLNDKITEIPSYAFSDTPRLKEVKIQSLEGLKVIGEYAFARSGLQTIVIPDTVTTFAGSEPKPFSECSSLTNIFFERNTVLEHLPSFEGLTGLETITIENLGNPNGVRLTSAYTFSGCTSLKEIKIPSSIKHKYDLGDNWGCAFQNCTSLESITFLDNYNEFSYDFNGMNSQITDLDLSPLHNFKDVDISISGIGPNVKSLTIPAEAERLSLSADGSMSVTVNAPEGNNVNTLSEYVFPSAESLDFNIFPNLTTLGASAFAGNTSLKELTIPANVTEIEGSGYGVFKNLISLEKLNIASDLASSAYMSNSAFEGTSGFELHFEDSISKINYGLLAAAYGHYSSITFDPNMSFFVLVDGSKIHDGPFAELEKGRYDYATDGDGNLYLINKDGTATLILVNRDSETVNIPAAVGDYSVTSIASDAFKDSKATSAVFAAPEAITSIAERAFADASQLASINDMTTVKGVKLIFTKADIPANAFNNTLITADSDDGENYLDGASAVRDTVKAPRDSDGIQLLKIDTIGQDEPNANGYCKTYGKVVEGEVSDRSERRNQSRSFKPQQR